MPKYSPLFHDLQHKPHLLLGLISLGIGTVLLVSATIMFLRVQKLEKNFDDTASQREIFSTNFSEVLFNDHLSIMEKNKLEFELARLNSELSKLKGTSDETTADEIYVLYAQFNDKLNSFDYALYNSDSDSWINEGARGWSATGLMTFSGGGGSFYSASSDFGGGSVDAGISNYPSLVKNGEIVIDEGALDSYQKDVKGSRGVIGIGGGNIFLAIVTNATVVDAAYAIQAAGAEDALNLDGGGSSALYNGGYLVGPGRSLPNAVVLTR